MKSFLTLDETHIDPDLPLANREGYSMHTAARAVVMDSDGAVALLHVTKKNYYKLPGGGIEGDEDPKIALARELQEEIGCKADIIAALGTVQEYRYFWNMNQLSYCYLARIVGDKGEPDFTDTEIADGFEIVWAKDIDAAAALVSNSHHPDAHLGVTFMRIRDAAIIERAKQFI